ncbi:MAG TPA: DUF4129 domain-containing protein [Pirellulaceae bacterium]|nr:DUF4129 domain-containing protein [Pirellulaceae bacterium]
MSRRQPETLADYLVVAICPALIMLLVGSLMWFLVEVFYQGEYKLRLLWVMAMFVLAIVGIARIAMEKGMAYASMFGWALAAAIALALAQFVKDGLIVGGPIMVLVWWAAHKLTWDCTLIDDTQDASGQGLLQQMGLDPSAAPAGNAPPGTTTRTTEPEATTPTAPPPEPPWWETLLEPDRRPHAPGVWVVYFSLAALPLFGIGGWFVPSSDPVARSRVFGLLVIYVASGMGLLLATSFLGLRRYLRQRKLEMPVEMTTTWILVGIVMIFAMLIVAAILPRPSREYSLSQLPFTVTSAVRRASRFAMGKEGTKDDSAKNPATTDAKDSQATDRKGGSKSEVSKPQSNSSDSSGQQQQQGGKGGSGGKSGQGKGSGESSKSQSGGGSKGDKGGKSQSDQGKGGESKGRDGESQSDEKSKGDSQGKSEAEQAQQKNQSSDQNAPQPPREETQPQSASQSRTSAGQIISSLTSLLGTGLGFIIKWLFYAGLIFGAMVAAWIYREELRAAWRKLMDELRELWDAWFGKKKPTEQPAAAGEVEAPPRTFASFADPFASGDARGMSWPQLVRYTFEALEAWGHEQGCPRDRGQTPHEFALALAAVEPQIANHVQTLAASYSQLAYAPRAGVTGAPEPLRQLWIALRARHANLAVI